MDKNNDGKISLDEFVAAGVHALPSFEGLGAEGHHYDVESGMYTSIRPYQWADISSIQRILPTSRR